MKTILIPAILFSALTACVPWTVRPIQDDSEKTSSTATSKSPAAYVDSIWDAKLLPAILSSAKEARTLLDQPSEPTRKYQTLKGSGRVLKADTTSRNGLLLIDVAPFDGKPDVSIQIGPVIRGSALRDATDIIRFTDFANQIAFADANNALNDRVLKSVIGSTDPKALTGHTIEFAGAFDTDGAGTPAIRGVIPIQFKDTGDGR